MPDPVSIVVLFVVAALTLGLVSTAAETSDIQQLARALAEKAAATARRFATTTALDSSTIAGRVAAMCRYEIGELARAASPGREAAAQEQRLRDACVDIAAKLSEDTRRS